jgi:hypothetical protein
MPPDGPAKRLAARECPPAEYALACGCYFNEFQPAG